MEQSEISNLCGVTASSISRDFNGTEFKNTDATIDVNLLFASDSDIAIKLRKKYAALQLNQYKAQTEIAKKQLDAMRNELIATKEKFNATYSETVQQQTDLMQFETKTEQLKFELNKLKQENTKLKNLSDTATKKNETCDTLQNELTKATDETKRLKEDLKSTYKQIDSLTHTCNDKETTCNNLATQNESLQHKTKQLQSELDKLSDAKQRIEKLENENELQRSELLMVATGTDKQDLAKDFFTHHYMKKFYMLLVLIGTYSIALHQWSVMLNDYTVHVLAFLLSTSIIFTSYNRGQNKFINRIVMILFVFVEVILSARHAELFNYSFLTGDFITALGMTIPLPLISIVVANLNTKQSVTYQLDTILNAVGVIAKKHGIDNVLRFRNDLIEKLNKK